jgi:hypothetical protein
MHFESSFMDTTEPSSNLLVNAFSVEKLQIQFKSNFDKKMDRQVSKVSLIFKSVYFRNKIFFLK